MEIWKLIGLLLSVGPVLNSYLSRCSSGIWCRLDHFTAPDRVRTSNIPNHKNIKHSNEKEAHWRQQTGDIYYTVYIYYTV